MAVVVVTHLMTLEVCLLVALVEVRATDVEEVIQAYLLEREILQMVKITWDLLLAVVVVGTHLLTLEVLTLLLVEVH